MATEKEYITIAGVQYYTTKEQIKLICSNCGFDSVSFRLENISGKFRAHYYFATFKHSFRSMLEKVKASRLVKLDLDKLEVV